MGVLVVAGATWVGAALAIPVSLWWAGALALLGAGVGFAGVGRARVGAAAPRSPVVVVGACGLLACVSASALASDAWAGLDAPVPSRLEGRVVLVGDPRPTRFGVRVEARADGRLWDLTADGEAAGVLGGLRAGESVAVAATTRAREPDDRWRASRHVVGTATVERAGAPAAAGGPWRVANAVHRALLRSTAHLPEAVRGVALGVALGDRGGIGELLAEDLRAAGLSHLTAVSGQHVALLVAMAAPVLSRLSARGAVVATMGLLAGFVVLTRGEPSVLRAAAMAVVVTAVRARGRRASAVRVLAVVVVALVLVDPLLVWSVGFQLSVAATAGIAVGAGHIGAALPGPRPIAAALGVSLAAQVAVTPLVIAHFGVMPLVGVAANLAVVPVIGPLMGWTLLAGVVAGVFPALASVGHLPTSVLGGWVVSVAEWSAALGLPGLRPSGVGAGLSDPVHVVALLALAATVGGVVWVRTGRPFVALGVAVAVAVAGSAVAVGGDATPGRHVLGAGAEVIAGGGTVVVVLDGRASPASVVGGLRRIGADVVDTVVARTGAPTVAAVVSAVHERLGVEGVVAPRGTSAQWEAVPVVEVGERWEGVVGALRVTATPTAGGRLEVVVGDATAS